MNAVPKLSFNDCPVMNRFVYKSEPFVEIVPYDNHATIKGHAAWYKNDEHETVCMLRVASFTL